MNSIGRPNENCSAYSNATAYSQDVMAIRDINVAMTKNAVHAVDQICPNLKFLTLQTGTNVGNNLFSDSAGDELTL